ncbi:TolC family protein [Shimia marina]|uniref:Type I secretion outer membrane protein, TolC family n=1 Tax=Shimia marina TaxID=321267 RepID=A0A0P1FEI1_9RHOB|nr:TolC family protein [Shimia marina]CUH53427.1 type I secretion outer membrane protein, TolC family [Shimia marina]SFD77231.1 outer membrane protein, adhesin transport system [Shimia marina]
MPSRPFKTTLPLLLGATVLSGCMSNLPELSNPLALLQPKPDATAPAEDVTKRSSFEQDTPEGEEAQSVILTTLLARQSVLEDDGTLGHVADVAVSSSKRSAEAELQTAKLRAEAEDKNWLPTIGPEISLTSLGDVIAGLVFEQVLFDHGRKKAERAYAAADVEVAAVTLSQDLNERSYTALALYLKGLRGAEKARVGTKGLIQLHEFERIVQGRVDGGIANKGDLRMVRSKIQTLETKSETARESSVTALAELQAMTGTAFSLTPAEPLNSNYPGVEPLDVLKARAEADRAVAQATVERAAQLPGLSASASVTNQGNGASLDVGNDVGLGLGTGARLKAIEASKDIAKRQVDEAREDGVRARKRLENNIVSLTRQESEATALAREGRDTYKLFEAQFRAGQRSVLEVVDVYEQSVLRALDGVDAKYDKILAQLELARDLGLLADGDKI